jgi:hypothetical protein
MAPTFYLKGQPPANDPLTREFERTTAPLTAVNPITDLRDFLTFYLADPGEMKLLHMITADPLRTPTYVMFGNPDYFFLTSGPDVVEAPGFAWNHGGVSPDINILWLGLVGPGVNVSGVDSVTWSDETDTRPTMLALTGLTDDYSHEGRALVEEFNASALPSGVTNSGANFVNLASAFKQINAPVGDLGLTSLFISTNAMASGTASNDLKYVRYQNQIAAMTTVRDALVTQMSLLLEGAEFNNKPISTAKTNQLITKAQNLRNQAHKLAGQ